MSPRGKHTIVAATLTMGTIIGGMGTARTTGLAHAMAPRIPANIIVSRDAYPAHGMPALAVDPRDRRAVIGVAKLFTRDGATLPFTFASVDGGVSWRDDGPLPLPSGYTFGSADATAAFTPRGTGLVAATAWGPTSGAIFVWRTTDGGWTFAPPVAVGRVPITMRRNALSRSLLPDQPHLAVDMTGGPHAGTVYLAFDYLTLTGPAQAPRVRVVLARSTDDGRSFTAPRTLPGSWGRPNVVVRPDGAVTVAYAALLAAGPRLAMARSIDGGQHFAAPAVIPWAPAVAPPSSAPWIRYWPSVAADPRDGMLYAAFCVARQGGARMDIALTRSGDGGRTWSSPVTIAHDPLGDAANRFQAQLTVTPRGTLYVSYDALAHGHIGVYLARSSTHGATFDRAERLSAAAFNPDIGTGDIWIGDYQGLAAGDDRVYAAWTDTRDGRLNVVAATIRT